MKLEKIKNKIKKALDRLYKTDSYLFKENLCEMCINHRFAMYLERQNFGRGYFVDCEYNRSYNGHGSGQKRVLSDDGNYIDIIITKRDRNPDNDLICFEIKKWNNADINDDKPSDIEKLKVLTGGNPSIDGKMFNYDYGFYLILGETRSGTKVEIYQKGILVESIK